MGSTRTKLLIVDDVPPFVDLVREILARFGCEIRVAFDGTEAVSIARDFRPDCVVTGIVMPKMDGFEEAKEILKFLPDCKFVLMSGSAYLQEFQDAHVALGFDRRLLLTKPFTAEELLAAMRLAGVPCFLQNPNSSAPLSP